MKIARNLCIKYSVFILLALLTSGAAIAPWLLPLTATAQPLESAAKDEVFGVTSVINLPGGQQLGSFDIGFVDPDHGVYLLADRTNKSIDVVNTSTNAVINQFKPGFVGTVPAASCPTGGANDCAGPDGVLVANGNQVWVGDGNSRVWVLDLTTGAPIGPSPISTALPGTTDQTRADELCHDANNGIILIANDASQPHPFVTFISSTDFSVLDHIVMDGMDGRPDAAGGIEQYGRRCFANRSGVPEDREDLLSHGFGLRRERWNGARALPPGSAWLFQS